MGLVDYAGGAAKGKAVSWVVKKLGLGGPIGAALTFYDVTKSALQDAQKFSAKKEAIPENSAERKILDALVRYSSGFGAYYKDYCYYEADYLEASLKDVTTGRGNLTLIRMKKDHHGSDKTWAPRAGALYLVVTRAMALAGNDDIEVISAITVTGETAPEKAYHDFLARFADAYIPFVNARRDRIKKMVGSPKHGYHATPQI